MTNFRAKPETFELESFPAKRSELVAGVKKREDEDTFVSYDISSSLRITRRLLATDDTTFTYGCVLNPSSIGIKFDLHLIRVADEPLLPSRAFIELSALLDIQLAAAEQIGEKRRLRCRAVVDVMTLAFLSGIGQTFPSNEETDDRWFCTTCTGATCCYYVVQSGL